MKKGKILFCLLIAALMLLAAACGGQSTEQSNETGETSAEKITLKIAHVVDPTHHYQIGAEYFKKLVEEKTQGRVEVQIFPSSQLGNERAILEGMKMGSIEMGVITSGALSGFVPEYAVLDLGYLFKDVDEAMNVLNGPIGEEFSQKMVDNGIRNLGTLRYGFRSVYANKPINSPEDLKGMKIRTMENPAHMDIFKALGANPTPMGYGELYTALQQKVVDGAENLPDLFYNSKHYEVAKEYSLTNQVYPLMPILQ
jgi:tripartite ATP-independent transporter DctP family solute receptor